MKETYFTWPMPVGDIVAFQKQLEGLPGCYVFSGACSYQVCFPLANGQELRFSIVDDEMLEGRSQGLQVDVWTNKLPNHGGV